MSHINTDPGDHLMANADASKAMGIRRKGEGRTFSLGGKEIGSGCPKPTTIISFNKSM